MRRLLRPVDGKGNYAAIVAHESQKTFMAMHIDEERKKAWAKVEPLLDGSPTPRFYEAIINIEKKRQRFKVEKFTSL